MQRSGPKRAELVEDQLGGLQRSEAPCNIRVTPEFPSFLTSQLIEGADRFSVPVAIEVEIPGSRHSDRRMTKPVRDHLKPVR